jgi:hypothetical protein
VTAPLPAFKEPVASTHQQDPLELTGLSVLMGRTSGSLEFCIGLIDGPVALDHPGLTEGAIRPISGAAACSASGAPVRTEPSLPAFSAPGATPGRRAFVPIARCC